MIRTSNYQSVLPQYQVGVQVSTEVVNGEILSVQTHVGEQVQLVPVVVQDEAALLVALLPAPGELPQAPLERVLVPAEYDVLCVDRDHLAGESSHYVLSGRIFCERGQRILNSNSHITSSKS